MNEIPIVFFAVKNKETTLFFDAYSQTDVTSLNPCVTPREYSNYYRYYINKYKNYNSIDLQLNSLKDNNYRQYSDVSNKKVDCNKISKQNEYFELEGKQLKNEVPILNFPCGNEVNQGPDEHGTQKWSVINYTNHKSSQPEFLSSDSNIYADLNKGLTSNKRKMYIKYPNRDNDIDKYYSNRESCKHCQSYPLSRTDFYFDQPSKYNFKYNTIPEALAMSVMVGINAIVEIISSIAIKFCVRIPDKDELHPGTGCVLMDLLNDQIDQLTNEKTEIHDESTGCKQSENVEIQKFNCEAWINSKLDEITNPPNSTNDYSNSSSRHSGLCDVFINNCYYRANESEFDPIKYSKDLPYTLPFVDSNAQSLKRGLVYNLGN